jgi:hypothetical protein
MHDTSVDSHSCAQNAQEWGARPCRGPFSKSARRGAPGQTKSAEVHCLILGFTAEYSKSVRKFTATYVSPIARMHPCTR